MSEYADKRLRDLASQGLILLNEIEAAHLLGLAVQTIRNYRHLRKGPAYHKIGRRVLYSRVDLESYKLKNRVDPEGSI